MLGKTFDSKDLETLAEDVRDLDDDIDRLVREGMLEEERESRGDRLTFSSGIVRDVLYAALSRRKRRSLHRKYAELVEKRNAGRLERVYPELVHHFSQADVPEKTVEYALKLAQKSLDAFSAEDAIRVAKIALDYLEDAEDAEDRQARGRGAAAPRPGPSHGRQHRRGAAGRRSRRPRLRGGESSRSGPPPPSCSPRRPPGRPGASTTRAGGPSAGSRRRASSGDAEHLARLLSLAATLANLRGEYAKAAAYQAEIEKLTPEAKAARGRDPAGRNARRRRRQPDRGDRARPLRDQRGAGGARQRLRAAGHDGRCRATSRPALCERWTFEEDGLAVRLQLRSGVGLLGRRAGDRGGRQGLARALDPAVSRTRCPRLSSRSAASRSTSTGRRRRVEGIAARRPRGRS